MIRRRLGPDWALISQNDHAILSGQLAERWGNAAFAPPVPQREFILAAAMHDAGWPSHDDAPTLNQGHEPLDVFESTPELAARVWRASADRAEAHGPFVGLMVSMHVLGLSGFLARAQHTPRETFEINRFQHREAERQESLRRQLNLPVDMPLTLGLAPPGTGDADDRVIFDFAILQAVDRMSLGICCTTAVFPKIDNVRQQVGSHPISINLRREGDERLYVSPWPFSVPAIELDVPFRRVGGGTFESDEALRHVYSRASVEHLRVTITEG